MKRQRADAEHCCRDDEGIGERASTGRTARVFRGETMQARGVAVSDASVKSLGDRGDGAAREILQHVAVANEMEDGRGDAIGALNVLKLELVSPGDDGSPQQLIGEND